MSDGSAATGPDGPGVAALLYLCMEVAGCPTVCRHCWAQGTGYGVMPLAEIEWTLEQAYRFCDGRGVGFDAYPMHEVAAHPNAARLFGLFNSHSGTARGCADGRAGTMFEPLTTTGVPLAVRDDWQEVLRAAAGTGTLNIWTAFHGTGQVHDRQAGRRGAFAETCRGVERARAMGISVGCNVFLTTASLPQLDELTAMLPPLGVHAMSIEIASFLPTPGPGPTSSVEIGGRPVRAGGCCHFHRTSRRCQRSTVPGVTIRCARSPAGSSRISAASTARSAQPNRGGRPVRRSIATSWRNTRISTSFADDERASSTSQLASLANTRYSNRTDTGRQHPTPRTRTPSP